jgi:hypothetical protein
MCRVEQRDQRVDLAEAGFLARDARGRRRQHHARIADAPVEQLRTAVKERAVAELALDGLVGTHQADALAHRVERLGILRDVDAGQRIDDGADAGGVDADLGEQAPSRTRSTRSTTN